MNSYWRAIVCYQSPDLYQFDYDSYLVYKTYQHTNKKKVLVKLRFFSKKNYRRAFFTSW